MFVIDNWSVAGTTKIVKILGSSLNGNPTFKGGKMFLDLFSTGDVAMAELMDKHSNLTVTLCVEANLAGSSEASSETGEKKFDFKLIANL